MPAELAARMLSFQMFTCGSSVKISHLIRWGSCYRCCASPVAYSLSCSDACVLTILNSSIQVAPSIAESTDHLLQFCRAVFSTLEGLLPSCAGYMVGFWTAFCERCWQGFLRQHRSFYREWVGSPLIQFPCNVWGHCALCYETSRLLLKCSRGCDRLSWLPDRDLFYWF